MGGQKTLSHDYRDFHFKLQAGFINLSGSKPES